MPKAAELDQELANGLKAAKSKQCFFALVLKGGTDGALLVSKTKIAAPAIAEAKKKSGGSALLSGRVSYEDGAYLFETAKLPPATAAQAVKTIVKRDAEMSIHAVFRQGTDPELVAEDGSSPATSPQTAPPKLDGRSPAESAYQARVNALSADLKKAIATGTAAGNEAKLRFSESQMFSRKKDFAQALKLIDVVDVQIKKALASAPPAPSGMRRLNDLTPKIKAAISAGGPNVSRIQALLATATGLIKNNDVTQADKVLDELEPLLAPAKGSGAVDLTAEWKTKLAEWTPEIKGAIVAKGSNAAAITKLMAQATAMSKPGGDMVQALAKLTECHRLATDEATTRGKLQSQVEDLKAQLEKVDCEKLAVEFEGKSISEIDSALFKQSQEALNALVASNNGLLKASVEQGESDPAGIARAWQAKVAEDEKKKEAIERKRELLDKMRDSGFFENRGKGTPPSTDEGELQKKLAAAENELALAFKNRLLRMQDRIKEAISADLPAVDDIKFKESEARAYADKKDFVNANTQLDELETLLKDALDAHGNVRELAEKEDSMVKEAITKVPPKAKLFQKGKFGARMGRISGMNDVTWDSMIGGNSNVFDVISQSKVFDEKTLTKDSKPISYLTFQDSMYPDEPGSREKLVLAFYDKKLGTIQDPEAKKKIVDAVLDMKAKTKIAGEQTATKEQKKAAMEAVNTAFEAMGMKGVRKGVEDERNEIKNRFFLGKDNAAINRGRAAHTLADTVMGFATKAQDALNKKRDTEKSKELTVFVDEVKALREKLDDVQRKLTGYIGKPPTDPAEIKKMEDLKAQEEKAADELKRSSEEAFEFMKGLDIGLRDEGLKKGEKFGQGFETGGGIGSDDGSGERDVYKSEKEVFMGKNLNMRDDGSAASAIFRELGIPFTGGASGSTVDAVGGIVDALLKDGENPKEALKETDERLASAEAETCMYIMGMHTAGHHSIVEMLYAAKQYPQKLFRNLRDPITDYVEWQEKCAAFLQKPLTEFQNKEGETQLDEKALAAKRYEAMVEACPEDIISHDACTKAFMSHCDKVLAGVEA